MHRFACAIHFLSVQMAPIRREGWPQPFENYPIMSVVECVLPTSQFKQPTVNKIFFFFFLHTTRYWVELQPQLVVKTHIK